MLELSSTALNQFVRSMTELIDLSPSVNCVRVANSSILAVGFRLCAAAQVGNDHLGKPGCIMGQQRYPLAGTGIPNCRIVE